MAQYHHTELFDGLYCSEQHWGDETEHRGRRDDSPPSLLIEKDLYWEEEEELVTLLSKQSEPESPEIGTPLVLVRRDAVNWILKVQTHYDFTPLTAVLAVNYLDRFLVRLRPWRDQPWMGQLAAVACLSLAAKVEETHVPLLLDFQVEDATYVFEFKTIKRMELLVLSTLQWKMNPVTPLSFVDYITRRLLGVNHHLCSEFLLRCGNLLLSLLSDLDLHQFLPSVVAAATMLHVIDGLEPRLAVEFQIQLLGLMAIDKEKLESCRKFMSELESRAHRRRKRSYGSAAADPGSPRGVMECVCFSSDSSNDSWAAVPPPSVSSSPELLFKKSRRDPTFL